MGSPTGRQRQFPSGAAYAEALQHTDLCFEHPELRGAKPELTKLGLPRAISGAFASVFSLTSAASGRRYAVKCFTRHVPDQESRYQAISDRLARLEPAELSQPWNLGFEYLPDAIGVGSQRYPVLKMEWTDAVTLSSWLDDHHSDRFAVDRLADRFEAVVRDLAEHEIAHGDLQHGNLLVASDDTFRLVDYDGMYVPALAGFGGTERGHRNYQSPMRGNDDFGAAMDRFSAWVIFMSLKAIAVDPPLWRRLHQPSGEFLLLTEEDFKNPGGSTGLRTLLAHPDSTVSGLADRVRSLAFQPLELLPPLADAIPRQRGAAATTTSASGPPKTASPAEGRLPDWMSGHVPSQAAPASAAPSTSSPDGFRIRTASDVVAAVLWPLSLVVAVLVTLTGFPSPLIGAAGAVIAAALFTAFAWSRRAERVRSRAVLIGLQTELARLDDSVKAAEKLRKDKATFDAAETKRTAAHSQAQDRLTAQYHAALKEAEKRKVRRQREVDKAIDGLSEELRKALGKALADKQSAYVRDQLGRRTIAQSPPHGIGPKLAARLAAAGIRTAADFKGYRPVHNTSYNTTGAVLVLSNGRAVNVQGIGEAKAIALDIWRQNLLAAAVARQPSALSAAERQQTEQSIALRRARLADRRKAVEAEAEDSRKEARRHLDAGQERLAHENALAGDRARRQRREFGRRTVELQQDSALHATLSASLQAAELHHRGLSVACYLRFLYTGR
ncbi:hypothetical protein ACQEVS_04835 [Streptomyces sp. CA-181903]|uniref:hypothetical protein n=1 Tax=Streptomyces sp. CA-181903 TaxID=3240055 RepID=UPI003D8AE1C8